MTDSPNADHHRDDSYLTDLRRRLGATRLVPGVSSEPWQRGTDTEFLSEVIDDWREFDWRSAEDRLLRLPWVRTRNGINMIHQRSTDETVPTVVLLHGWPDSFLRYLKVLPLLTDMHVLVPCLPGYPFSERQGTDPATMATQLATAVDELGYRRVVISGGDIGAQVAEAWARARPEQTRALHLTDVPYRHVFGYEDAELDESELAFKRRMRQWQTDEGAYAAQQSTKPNTLAVGLGDSPAGLAAWIIEKIRAWSDCPDGIDAVFGRWDLLTWLTVYWMTETIGTSFAPYALRAPARSDRIEVPTAITAFPRDPLLGPKTFAERLFDIRAWDDAPSGGHFGAWEHPSAFAQGLRTAVGLN